MDEVFKILGIIMVSAIVDFISTPIAAHAIKKNQDKSLLIMITQMSIKYMVPIALTIVLF